ncbi:DHA2 family efflux MFS transporter permease subunit [Allosphingosinicella deserti]|uniref:MFS transporter n=1 Tax=Allosphingosinicella deserti TaxID=2116704 RepID=A0A2P7QYR5_9SPHN|nr:DHA2 family efflux MFS transporter permease subunit [Sphingomonas deserti]PSJ43097.1 MFS transporter [Sphingomonas deserti]
MAGKPDTFQPLTGARLLLAGFTLAIANFMVVLDTTIANVSVPHIAGGLGIAPSQGVWVITSYAVAEAVVVPLTGWLAQRFGAVRSFAFSLAGFAFFSLLCGLSSSLTMLVACRIGQGLCGGPLMPLSQTLLLRIFPPEKRAQAMGMWAMTTVVGPIAGPILGGWISDNWSWPWVFFINLPVAALAVFAALRLLGPAETRTEKQPIDTVGLSLLVLWVGALQLMLDLGREHDWFASGMIVTLAIVAVVGFLVFIAWELTEEHPAVDLKVLRHRGFSFSVLALSFTFATFFASVVILPQWLQTSLGYTATEAGHITALNGVFALILSPVVARLSNKVDPRALVCFGISWLAMTSLLRTQWTTGADFWTLAMPQLLQGIGMPFFFVPLTTLALGAVEPRETASAAGLMSFLRTLAGAFGTSVAATYWENQAHGNRAELVGELHDTVGTVDRLRHAGLSESQAWGMIERLLDQESLMLATNHLFMVAAGFFAVAAAIIWLVPKPRTAVPMGAAH